MHHNRSLLANTPQPMFAYIFLAFIAMATLAYLNYLPSLVSSLAGALGFTQTQAGQIVAANGYGALAGSAIAIYLVNKLRWQSTLLSCLALLCLLELTSALASSYALMLSWRFVAGIAGGIGLGMAVSVLARLANPDRAFGMLLFIQFSSGSLVIYLLPQLTLWLGANAVFYVSTAIAALALMLLHCVKAITLTPGAPVNVDSAVSIPAHRLSYATLLLLAIALYQAAASAIWAYAGLMGQGAAISADKVSSAIAVSGLAGLAGAMLPVLSGRRVSRLTLLLPATALSALSALLLTLNLLPIDAILYGSALALLFFCWPAVVSFLLAVSAELDSSGRLATIAALVSSLGLASGPLLGAALADNNNFSALLFSCAVLFLLSYLLLFIPVRALDRLATEASSAIDVKPEYQR